MVNTIILNPDSSSENLIKAMTHEPLEVRKGVMADMRNQCLPE